MNNLFTFCLILLFVSIIMYRSGKGPIKIWEREDKVMKSNVGKKCVIDGDTLLIIDYSFFKDSYKLSNGVDINKNLMNKIIVK